MDERSRSAGRRGPRSLAALVLTLVLALLAVPAAQADDDEDPVAGFTTSTAAPVVGELVTFTSTSRDPDGRVVSWEWDLDGDKAYDDATGPTTSWAYRSAGPVTVRLRVRDNDRNSDGFARTITVVPPPPPPPPPPNQRPVARFSSTPSNPVAGQPVTFTSGSSDEDGRIVKQEWFLDPGNIADASGPTAARSYVAGSHEVRLVVTDDDGATSEATQTVNVAPASSPPDPTPPEPTPPGTTPPGGGTGPATPPPTAPGSFDLAPPPAAPTAPLGAVVPVLAPSLRWIEPSPLVRVRGRTTGRGARMNLVTVRLPAGARVAVSCRGRSCPSRIAARISRTAGLVRFRQLERFLRAGSVLEFRVTAAGRVGRYSRFLVRSLKPPLRTNRCLMPGSLSAVRCPAR